ncbi:MAG: Bifunctional oligoribonuclease and PAP phosphatase NrnA [Candidatus Scalindua arabica]|uniref:Bifunctional oligoribonuclease and PAP phosphatase NrnA n=1 Tax=Candidatus Scalindua arabica TaxID=1127984 RepID=A0A941W3T0_9BACT|nr:Bifunctional oligoribonuclease and PAP phosphatase NrnA [Candidatus Scalindua arabica]
MWERIVDVINEGKKFIITTHLFSEGDAIGSELALKRFLCNLNKEAVVVNNELLPPVYSCFDPDKDVKFLKSKDDNINLNDFDAIFMVDVAAWGQLGDFADMIKASRITKICIDHHPTNPGYADINVIDKDASSAGELIYDLITHMNGELTLEVATPLYLSIATDTGWFKFSNTSAKAFKACSALIEAGVKSQIIYEKLYHNKHVSYLKLLNLMLGTLSSECDGQLVWTKITKKMIKSSGVEFVDTDVIIDLIRAVNKVEVVVIFKELGERKTKVSFRSKHTIDVSKLASDFGGGGHVRAAGASLEEPIDTVIGDVVSVASELIEETSACVSSGSSLT